MTPTSTWKSFERWVAAYFPGGQRVGPAGAHEGQPDVITDKFVIECKYRTRKLPAWLTDAVAQAREQRDVTRTPIVVLGTKGQRRDHSLVVVRLDDFKVMWEERDETSWR